MSRQLHKLFIHTLLAVTLLGSTFAASAEPAQVIRLATTTSTQNSGLLDYLLPEFEAEGYDVQVIAVGTGKALQFGRQGDVDLLLTHAPAAEDRFIAEGYGRQVLPLMHNDFVFVGPRDDPAGLLSATTLSEALHQLVTRNARFLSRGDDSGTHKKERALWQEAELASNWSGYREVGQGMGRTLMMAVELDSYTLTDRGTWLAMQDQLPSLQILFSGDASLFNPYRIVLINPQRHPHLNHEGARALATWLTRSSTLSRIADYRVHGSVLFVPVSSDQRVAIE